MQKTKLIDYSIFSIFFFSLGGYYALLILISNLLSNEFSRLFTIPIRLLIILSIIFIYIIYKYKKKITLTYLFFLLFSSFYLIRIAIESIQEKNLYMSSLSFLFYFISFVFIPITLISNLKFNSFHYSKIFWIMIIGCFATSILTAFFYNDYLGEVARISAEVKKDDNYISPLALSYVSVLGIGLGLSYLITNNLNKKETLFLVVVILSCFIPFFLGASRGAIIALIFPFFIYCISSKNLKSKFSMLIIGLIFIGAISIATFFLGTGVFDRFLNIGTAIEQGNSSAVRLIIWENELIRFMENPLFGYSLQSNYAGHHPHNILIEALITTGLLGAIPYFSFLIAVFLKSISIIRKNPEYFWVVVLFYMGFAQNMFSGAIWGTSFLALGAALIIGYDFRSPRESSYK